LVAGGARPEGATRKLTTEWNSRPYLRTRSIGWVKTARATPRRPRQARRRLGAAPQPGDASAPGFERRDASARRFSAATPRRRASARRRLGAGLHAGDASAPAFLRRAPGAAHAERTLAAELLGAGRAVARTTQWPRRGADRPGVVALPLESGRRARRGAHDAKAPQGRDPAMDGRMEHSERMDARARFAGVSDWFREPVRDF